MQQNLKENRIRQFNNGRLPWSIITDWPMPELEKERIYMMAMSVPRNEFPAAERLFPIWEEMLTYWQQNDVDDDELRNPGMIYPKQYDQGIFGAMLGADMEFLLSPEDGGGWASSNSKPFVDKSYKELLAMNFNPDSGWMQRMRHDLAYFTEKSHGRFRVSTTTTIDGFNFGHQIAGFRIFTDIYDNPDELKALMTHAIDINIDYIEYCRDATGEAGLDESLISGGLFPRKTVAMSVDTYNMCAPSVYAEFGRPYHQQLIDYFGGGSYHLHGNGRHLIPELAQLSGFVHVDITDDGARIRAFDDRFSIRKLARELLFSVACTGEELIRAINEKSLVPARYRAHCGSRTEAQRLVERFRQYKD